MSEISNQNSVNWFAKHPLIATVLWIMGTAVEKTPSTDSEEERKSSSLTWKDDHGGHIAEYMEQIQSQSKENQKIENSPKKKLNLSSKNLVLSDESSTKSTNWNEESEVTQSPQWGFYVSITPPSESYSRHNP